MIPFVIAALIGQPLDATYSTAEHPRNAGLIASFKYPSAWTRDKDVEDRISHAVVVLGDDRAISCVLHVQDMSGDRQVAALSDEEAERLIISDLLPEGAFVPREAKVSRRSVGTDKNGATFQVVEYHGVLNHSAVRGRLYLKAMGKRAVCLRLGCVAEGGSEECEKLFAANSALFDRIFESLVDETPREKPQSFFNATTIGVIAAVVFIAMLLCGRYFDQLARAGKLRL